MLNSTFDEGHEVRGVFPDISKTFDKVWHKVVLFNLKKNGIPVVGKPGYSDNMPQVIRQMQTRPADPTRIQPQHASSGQAEASWTS